MALTSHVAESHSNRWKVARFQDFTDLRRTLIAYITSPPTKAKRLHVSALRAYESENSSYVIVASTSLDMSRYFADFADRRRGTDEEVARITSDIQSLYDSGTRLFTKEAIRDIAQQLENTQNGQKIFVRGINGVTVGFDVEYGEVDPHPDDPSLEQVA